LVIGSPISEHAFDLGRYSIFWVDFVVVVVVGDLCQFSRRADSIRGNSQMIIPLMR
jgi:hypothetical protein